MDAVVTKDYLDARLDALEFRMDAKLEFHFGAIHIGPKFHRRLLPLKRFRGVDNLRKRSGNTVPGLTLEYWGRVRCCYD
jgi:hypothetical protein